MTRPGTGSAHIDFASLEQQTTNKASSHTPLGACQEISVTSSDPASTGAAQASIVTALRLGLKSLARRVRGSHDPAMTEAIAFDTHRSVKRLTDGGLAEQQAEVLVVEQVALLDANLATKAGIKAVKSDLPKWMFGAMITQGGLIVAVVKLL